MDISVIPVAKPAYIPAAPSAGRLAPTSAAAVLSSSQGFGADANIASDIAASAGPDAQRQGAVEQAAQAMKDSFPANDVRFTIYKDSAGQYVTRFTDLNDGKVTYYPEQTMFAYFKKLTDHSTVNIKA